MPIARHLDQPVHLGDQSPAGVFSNAFRILCSGDDQCVLEFLVFSPSEQKAYVIRRVQLRLELVPLIKDQIALALGLEPSR